MRAVPPAGAELAASHGPLQGLFSVGTFGPVDGLGIRERLLTAANGHDRITSQEARRHERGAMMSEVTEQQLEGMEALFVQTAASPGR